MTDKRSHPRRLCNTRIDVLDVDSNEVIGSLVNISLSGFMLITQKALPENYVFQFLVVFTASGQEKITIKVGAESLWIQEVEDSEQRWVGFHIIDISPQDSALLGQLLDH